ncbi:MAG: hypothetical protein V3R85_05170 [Alphaproteobacteria bacterium]
MTGALRNAALAICFLAVLGVGRANAAAGSATEFYTGRNIQILIGAEVGSTYDKYARVLGRHIKRYIPGGPSVVFKNSIGADGRKALTWLHEFGANDGSIIGAVRPDAIMAPLLIDKKSAEAIKYDPLRFVFIGSAARTVHVCIIRNDSPAQTLEEARKQPLIMGANRQGGPLRNTALALARVLGARFRIVNAYRDLAQTVRGLEEGEVHGICGYEYGNLMRTRPDLIKEDKVKIMLQYALKGHSALLKRNIPMMWNYSRNDSEREVLRILTASQVFARPYLLPPGVPSDRVGVLRSAFERTMRDLNFQADARKAKLDLYLTSGREIDSQIKKLFSAPDFIVERARAARQG